ncbi:MAG: hypothetical protein ACLR1F_19965 [Enterococcus avium]
MTNTFMYVDNEVAISEDVFATLEEALDNERQNVAEGHGNTEFVDFGEFNEDGEFVESHRFFKGVDY